MKRSVKIFPECFDFQRNFPEFSRFSQIFNLIFQVFPERCEPCIETTHINVSCFNISFLKTAWKQMQIQKWQNQIYLCFPGLLLRDYHLVQWPFRNICHINISLSIGICKYLITRPKKFINISTCFLRLTKLDTNRSSDLNLYIFNLPEKKVPPRRFDRVLNMDLYVFRIYT